jgi:hypothetical protein
MRAGLLCSLLFLMLPEGASSANETLALTSETSIVLATVAQAREALSQDDAFAQALSRFDLESRLQTADRATVAAWKAMVADQVRPWEASERDGLFRVLESLSKKLKPFHLPLPKQILLMHTTGKEEGHAAYCRGAAIVLPDKILAQSDDKLERLLAHELFHVLSNQNPKVRFDLYSIIGFRSMPPLDFPASLRDRKITNPDAPQLDAWIELEMEGKKVPATPILYASAERYEPASGRSFFDYLTFRLLVLKREGDAFAPAMEAGEPILLDPRSQESYMTQIGRNTNYIIHPDEILADNFVHLVLGRQPLATPRIVEEMRRVFTR